MTYFYVFLTYFLIRPLDSGIGYALCNCTIIFTKRTAIVSTCLSIEIHYSFSHVSPRYAVSVRLLESIDDKVKPNVAVMTGSKYFKRSHIGPKNKFLPRWLLTLKLIPVFNLNTPRTRGFCNFSEVGT